MSYRQLVVFVEEILVMEKLTYRLIKKEENFLHSLNFLF